MSLITKCFRFKFCFYFRISILLFLQKGQNHCTLLCSNYLAGKGTRIRALCYIAKEHSGLYSTYIFAYLCVIVNYMYTLYSGLNYTLYILIN